MELLLISIAAIYLAEYLFFVSGMSKSRRMRGATHHGRTVSVVVAARNEEENIERCLNALAEQSYPQELVEFIIVDDESEDRTNLLIRKFFDGRQGRWRLIETVAEQSGLRGKTRALAQGIDCATGEIILVTDADCSPDPGWVSAMAGGFQEGVDMVGGFTVVRPTGLFARLQQLDWLHLQSIASASLAFSSPVGVVGNNLGFRRQTYDRIGGFRNLPHSVTEDFALLRAFLRAGAKAIYPLVRAGKVYTEPVPTLRAVVKQKHRWGRGGLESTLHGYSILVIAFLMLVSFLLAPFVSPLAWAVVWSSKFLADLLLLGPVLRTFREGRSLTAFLPFQFYFLAQAVVVPLLLFNRRVEWKGRVFETVGSTITTQRE